jgi:hypothetical protein
MQTIVLFSLPSIATSPQARLVAAWVKAFQRIWQHFSELEEIVKATTHTLSPWGWRIWLRMRAVMSSNGQAGGYRMESLSAS